MAEPDAPRPADPASLGFERIRYAKDAGSGVATVTIDRPQVLNAFDFRTLRELGRAFEDASWDDTMAVVVVTGAGDRAFCTGADLDEQAEMGATSGQYWRWMGAFIEMHDRLRQIGKPTIARINGIAVGGPPHRPIQPARRPRRLRRALPRGPRPDRASLSQSARGSPDQGRWVGWPTIAVLPDG